MGRESGKTTYTCIPQQDLWFVHCHCLVSLTSVFRYHRTGCFLSLPLVSPCLCLSLSLFYDVCLCMCLFKCVCGCFSLPYFDSVWWYICCECCLGHMSIFRVIGVRICEWSVVIRLVYPRYLLCSQQTVCVFHPKICCALTRRHVSIRVICKTDH